MLINSKKMSKKINQYITIESIVFLIVLVKKRNWDIVSKALFFENKFKAMLLEKSLVF